MCRVKGMEITAEDLMGAARRLRASYDGQGSHLMVAYEAEREAADMRAGVITAPSAVVAALVAPWLAGETGPPKC